MSAVPTVLRTYISNLRVRGKLLLLLSLPSAGLCCLGLGEIERKAQSASAMNALRDLSRFSVLTSQLVHETQKERAASAVFVGSHGAKMRDQLLTQRQKTDEAAGRLESYLSSVTLDRMGKGLPAIWEQAKQRFGALTQKRGDIDAFRISASESVDYFNALDASLLAVVSQTANCSADSGVARLLTAYVSLLQAK